MYGATGHEYSLGRVFQNSPVPIPINRNNVEIGAVPTTLDEKKRKTGAGSTGAKGPKYYSDKEGNEQYLNPPHNVGRIRSHPR
jgi:hypothetical protein